MTAYAHFLCVLDITKIEPMKITICELIGSIYFCEGTYENV